MTDNIKQILHDLNNMTQIETEDYFNNHCYLVKKDFGLLLSELVGNIKYIDILTTCLASKKFKEMPNACDEWGNPIVQMILYTIVGYNELPECPVQYKDAKELLLNVLFNKELILPWAELNDVYETPLHIAYAFQRLFDYEELVTLTNKAIEFGVHVSNKDIDSNDLSSLLIKSTSLDIDQQQYLLNIINAVADTEVMTIDSSIYC